MTASLRLPVSLQVVLRALIEDGLEHEENRRLLSRIEDQARTVHENRRRARAVRPAADGRRAT